MYTVNWDWVFLNFRAALARRAMETGWKVSVVCPRGDQVGQIMEEGFSWIEWPLDRRSMNPLKEMGAVIRLARLYAKWRPDLIHHDTMKPNVYGAAATWFNLRTRTVEAPPALVCSFMGTGFLFSDRALARLIRPYVEWWMRTTMRQEHVWETFSNWEDCEAFVDRGVAIQDHTRVIVSECVDTSRFSPEPEGRRVNRVPRVLMAARMLWDKGVGTYVEAAQLLSRRGVEVEMLLAGEPDLGAQGYVPYEKLHQWNKTEEIEWLGYCSDMPDLLRRVDIAALPSQYNEGLPRFLVESAASGLPLIATDLPACRRVVQHRRNGLLVRTGDARGLADAIETLVKDRDLRDRMGDESRTVAKEKFAEERVLTSWIRLYEQVLS